MTKNNEFIKIKSIGSIDEKKWKSIFVVQGIIEYLLFRSYVLREAVDKIPRNFDQTHYLKSTYLAYYEILNGNIEDILLRILFKAGTTMTQYTNAILLFLFGDNRFSLLLFNFGGLLILQFFGAYLVYKVSKSRSIQCLYNGMVMMLGTHFIYAGDLTDYRMDYVASCIFTIVLLALVFFIRTNKKEYYIISAAFSGIVVFVRFNIVVYVVLVVFLTQIFKIWGEQHKLIDAFRDIVQYGIICIVCGGWSILTNFNSFFKYYITFHAGELSKTWALNGSFWEEVLFYPKCIVNMHLGKTLTIICVLICILIVSRWICKHEKIDRTFIISVLTIFSLWICQLIILIKNPVKINTTASSMNGIVLTIVIIFAYEGRKDVWIKRMIYLLSIVVMCMGISNFVRGTMQKHYQEGDKSIKNIQMAIEQYMIETEKEKIVYLSDIREAYDLLYVMNAEIALWEKNKIFVDTMIPDEKYSSLSLGNSFSLQEVMQDIAKCDIVIITKEGIGDLIFAEYDIDKSWEKYRNEIWKYMEENNYFNCLIDTTIQGFPIRVYGRDIQSYKAKGVYMDGWSGECIEISGEFEPTKMNVVFQSSATEFIGKEGNIIEIWIDDKYVETKEIKCKGESIALNELINNVQVEDKIEIKVKETVSLKQEMLSEDDRILGIKVVME